MIGLCRVKYFRWNNQDVDKYMSSPMQGSRWHQMDRQQLNRLVDVKSDRRRRGCARRRLDYILVARQGGLKCVSALELRQHGIEIHERIRVRRVHHLKLSYSIMHVDTAELLRHAYGRPQGSCLGTLPWRSPWYLRYTAWRLMATLRCSYCALGWRGSARTRWTNKELSVWSQWVAAVERRWCC